MVVSGRGEAQVDRVEVDYPMLELELSGAAPPTRSTATSCLPFGRLRPQARAPWPAAAAARPTPARGCATCTSPHDVAGVHALLAAPHATHLLRRRSSLGLRADEELDASSATSARGARGAHVVATKLTDAATATKSPSAGESVALDAIALSAGDATKSSRACSLAWERRRRCPRPTRAPSAERSPTPRSTHSRAERAARTREERARSRPPAGRPPTARARPTS